MNEQFLVQNAWVIVLAVLWALPWKGAALWKAARNSDRWWFIALILINTLGLLEILYIFVFSKKKSEPTQPQNV
jgi:hypothetical protein